MHDRKVIHRDIKLQNVFVNESNRIKVGDFGIAKVLNNTKEKLKTMIGSPFYLSPEIIQHQPYSFSSDIWSLGVLLYHLCQNAPPFQANNIPALAIKIIKGIYSYLYLYLYLYVYSYSYSYSYSYHIHIHIHIQIQIQIHIHIQI